MAEKYGKKVRELMVKEMEDIFKTKKGVVFSSYDRINASKIDSFRRKVNGAGSRYFILKKRLSRIAMENAGLSELSGVLDERKNIGVAVIEDDPVVVAKILMDFAREDKNFFVSSGCLDGQIFGAEKVKELAELPGREQLLAMVVGAINAPISGFVGVLASVLRSLCNVLNAIKEEKGN